MWWIGPPLSDIGHNTVGKNLPYIFNENSQFMLFIQIEGISPQPSPFKHSIELFIILVPF